VYIRTQIHEQRNERSPSHHKAKTLNAINFYFAAIRAMDDRVIENVTGVVLKCFIV